MQFVTEIIVVLMLMAFLLWTETLSSLVVIVSLSIALSIFYLVIRRKLAILGEKYNFYNGQIIQQVNQGLGSIKETKILGREHFFDKIYSQNVKEISNIYHFQQVIGLLPRNYIETITITIILSIMIYLLSVGAEASSILVQVTIFAIAAIRLMPSLSRISAVFAVIKFYIPSLEEAYSDFIMCEKHTFSNVEAKDGEKFSFNNLISIKGISFIYENAKSEALKNISLDIEKKNSVAFVGPSGSGKTTTVDILLGLLKPNTGGVYIDGCDIEEGLRAWQSHIGYIPQQIYILDDIIKRNVAFGVLDKDIDEDKVWNALRVAQLEDFVKSLPDGLNAKVGEHGARVSGGQRQRIGIARALYHDPEVLVMDEATAALDNETEKAFMESIDSLSGKKTIVLIAHRLSTVQNCDKIFYLSKGKLVASGTYPELMEKSPEFKKMAEASNKS